MITWGEKMKDEFPFVMNLYGEDPVEIRCCEDVGYFIKKQWNMSPFNFPWGNVVMGKIYR